MKEDLLIFSVSDCHQLISDLSTVAVWSAHKEMEHVNPVIKYLYGDRLSWEPAFRIRARIIRALQASDYEY